MRLVISLLVFFHLQSFAISSTSDQEGFCGVIGMYAVSPKGELKQFLFVGPPKCYDEKIKVDISKEWLVTACAYFTTQQHKPTYQVGEELNWSSKIFYYLPSKPDVVFPNKNAGSDLENPVVYVQESNLSKGEICNGIMHKM